MKKIRKKKFICSRVNINELRQNKEDSKIKCINIGRPAYRIGKEKDFMSHKMKVKFWN